MHCFNPNTHPNYNDRQQAKKDQTQKRFSDRQTLPSTKDDRLGSRHTPSYSNQCLRVRNEQHTTILTSSITECTTSQHIFASFITKHTTSQHIFTSSITNRTTRQRIFPLHGVPTHDALGQSDGLQSFPTAIRSLPSIWAGYATSA